MRRLLRSGWIRAFLVWTAIIAVLIVPMWPAATTAFPPCNSGGATSPDPALPTCPPDNANYEAIGVFLYAVLWLIGAIIMLVAFAVSRARRRGT